MSQFFLVLGKCYCTQSEFGTKLWCFHSEENFVILCFAAFITASTELHGGRLVFGQKNERVAFMVLLCIVCCRESSNTGSLQTTVSFLTSKFDGAVDRDRKKTGWMIQTVLCIIMDITICFSNTTRSGILQCTNRSEQCGEICIGVMRFLKISYFGKIFQLLCHQINLTIPSRLFN